MFYSVASFRPDPITDQVVSTARIETNAGIAFYYTVNEVQPDISPLSFGRYYVRAICKVPTIFCRWWFDGLCRPQWINNNYCRAIFCDATVTGNFFTVLIVDPDRTNTTFGSRALPFIYYLGTDADLSDAQTSVTSRFVVMLAKSAFSCLIFNNLHILSFLPINAICRHGVFSQLQLRAKCREIRFVCCSLAMSLLTGLAPDRMTMCIIGFTPWSSNRQHPMSFRFPLQTTQMLTAVYQTGKCIICKIHLQKAIRCLTIQHVLILKVLAWINEWYTYKVNNNHIFFG